MDVVKIRKPQKCVRIGISLMRSCPAHPTVRYIIPGSLASQRRGCGSVISPFDRVLAVNGVRVRTARDAARCIREAEGTVLLSLQHRPPSFVTDAASRLQRRWRQRQSASVAHFAKESRGVVLGITFSPEYTATAVVCAVSAGGAAAAKGFRPGDLVTSVNGFHASSPELAARLLREARGDVVVVSVPCHAVDHDALLVEQRLRREMKAAGEEEEACALCFDGMRDPVAWPAGCTHSFCARCTYRALDFGIRACPLCRAERTASRRSGKGDE